MLARFAAEFQIFVENAKLEMPFLLTLIGLLWLVNIINWLLLKSKLNYFGIYPRHPFGMIGIPVSWVLHQDFNHLFFNTIPLFGLSLYILVFGEPVFLWVSAMVIISSGAMVWCFGRRGIHIGASGLVSGYFGFVLASAYQAPSISILLLAVVVMYYFSGVFLSLIPSEEKVSWEAHVFGMISGVVARLII